MTTGGYTKVPLRGSERWTGARLQQGQSLLEHEANLTLDALSRADRDLARDAIGWAGVVAGSTAFGISVVPGDLVIGAGRMWVDGLEAYAPEPFRYTTQDQVPALPASGLGLVYVDAFVEHVQPAEDPVDLVDPALAPIETAARQRTGYRVRVFPTTATTCDAAFAALAPVGLSTGRLTIDRTAPPGPADPCDPPGDPLGLVPDGLLRVEVLDTGGATNARFAWSAENGAAAVAVATAPVGNTVTLAPSASVKFAKGEKVEVSGLSRRADRLPHGPLYTVMDIGGGAAGQVLTLDRAVTAAATSAGLCVRRWDGEAVGAAAATKALIRGADLGIVFTAGAGSYLAGDWWGSRLRAEAAETVERRLNVLADGTGHACAPLALVDFGAGTVVSDCRPSFTPLVDQQPARGQGVCTVTVFPGDDLQAAADSLPPDGGELCIAAGQYALDRPVTFVKRRNVVVSGTGPATRLVARASEAVFVFDRCTDVEVRHLAASGGIGKRDPRHLSGALTFTGCVEVRVVDCDVSCPDSEGRAQSCIAVRTADDDARTMPDRVRIEGNRCDVGAWQTGILVADSDETAIAGNTVRFTPTSRGDVLFGGRDFAIREVSAFVARDAAEKQPSLAMTKSARTFAAKETKDGTTSRKAAYRSYVTKALLSRDVPVELTRVVKSLRVGGQGIVVAGTRVGSVRVLDNLVDGFVQGVHVAASDARTPAREVADEVYLRGNVVHALVPVGYNRSRHAVYVGNAQSVHVIDTIATLRRPGGTVVKGATRVDGIVVTGTVGAFLVVRQSSLRGFGAGVRVDATVATGIGRARMWLVAETSAVGAGASVVAVPAVQQERNVP